MEIAAGIDFGGSSVKMGLIDRQGTIHAHAQAAIDQRADFETIMGDVVLGLHALLEGCHEDHRLMAIGIGAPGFTDKDSGTLVGGCENLPSLRNRSIQGVLGGVFGVPAFGDNDATCAAAGELSFGAGRDLANFALITLGTGIGGGLVLDGNVYRGARGFAAEIGHVCVDPNGLWCNCGSRGCFEQYASGPAIVRIYGEKRGKRGFAMEDVTPKDVVDRARAGDGSAVDTIEEAGRWIAQVFGTLLNILNLEACIVGGGISEAGDILLDPIRRHLPDHVWPLIGKGVRVVAAHLRNDAGILGAAAQAFERIHSERNS